MSEHIIRSYIRTILLENVVIAEAAAKNWDEYIEKTTKKYEGLTDAGKEVDES